MDSFLNSLNKILKTKENILKTTKWDTNKLNIRSNILLKSSFPPTVYANKKVLPWPGSIACRQPNIKIEVVVKVSLKMKGYRIKLNEYKVA